VEASNFTLVNNLITLVYWSATLQTSSQSLDFTYPGAVEVADSANDFGFTGNLIAGVERIGFKFKGTSCDFSSTNRNAIYGAATGIAIISDAPDKCVKVSGFTVFKSTHYGIYYQGRASLVVDNNILVDNQIGVSALMIGQSALFHVLSDQAYTVTNSIFVGQSSSFDCDHDVRPLTVSEEKSQMDSFGAGSDGKAKIAIAWPAFISKPNGAPVYSW